jgi:hypothetical protein
MNPVARRKPLPYSASQAVDEAIMANSQAAHCLRPFIQSAEMNGEERIRRVAEALNHIYDSSTALRSIRIEVLKGCLPPSE